MTVQQKLVGMTLLNCSVHSVTNEMKSLLAVKALRHLQGCNNEYYRTFLTIQQGNYVSVLFLLLVY